MKGPDGITPKRWQLQEWLFGTVKQLTANQALPSSAPIVLTIAQLIQLLSFPLHALGYGHWSRAFALPVSEEWGKDFLPVTFWISFIIAAGYVGLLVAVTVQHSNKLQRIPLLDTVAQRWAWLFSNLFYLPVTQTLLHSLKCIPDGTSPNASDVWVGGTELCWSGLHLAAAFLCSVLIAFTSLSSAFLLATAFTFKIPFAVHGRNHAALLGCKLILSMIAVLMGDSAGELVAGIAILGTALVWSASVSLYPHTSLLNIVNTHVMCAGIFGWGGLSVLLASREGGLSQAQNVFVGGWLLAAVSAYGCSSMRFNRMFLRPFTKAQALANPILANCWARWWLTARFDAEVFVDVAAFKAASRRTNRSVSSSGVTSSSGAMSVAGYDSRGGGRFSVEDDGKSCVGSVAHGDDSHSCAGSAFGEDAPRLRRGGGAGSCVDGSVYGNGGAAGPSGAMTAITNKGRRSKVVAGKSTTSRYPATIGAMFEHLRTAEPSSPFGLLVASLFHRDYAKHKYLEMNILRLLYGTDAPLDIQFLAFHRLAIGNDESADSSSGLGRVQFDHHQAEASKHLTICYSTRVELWRHLLAVEPDIGRLVELGFELEKATKEVHHHLNQLLLINPQSVDALESMARFHRELRNDKNRAEKLVMMSRRAQEQQSRGNEAPVRNVRLGMRIKSDVDLLDENACVIQISAEFATIGEIVSANRAVYKVFGRLQQQVIGENISQFMPEPFRTLHDSFLTRYITSGNSAVINSTRALFALTAGQTLTPMWLTLRETPPLPGTTRPLFAGVLQPINTPESHILVTSRDTSYRVIAACKRSQTLLGMDGETLADEMPALGRWISDFADGLIAPSTSSDEVHHAVVKDEIVPGSEPVDIAFSVQTLQFPSVETSYIVCWEPRLSTVKPAPAASKAMNREQAPASFVLHALNSTARMNSLGPVMEGSDDDSSSSASVASSVENMFDKEEPAEFERQQVIRSNSTRGGAKATRAGSVGSDGGIRAVEALFVSLRSMIGTRPPEVRQIKRFFLGLLMLILTFAILFGYTLGTSVSKSSTHAEVLGRVHHAFTATVYMDAQVDKQGLQQYGWDVFPTPDGVSPADHQSDLFKSRLLTFGTAFDALDSQVTTDWPKLRDAWVTPSLRVHSDVLHGVDVNVTVMEAVRIVERVGGDVTMEIKEGVMTCPSDTVQPLHGAIARLNSILPRIPMLLMDDFVASADSSRFLTVIIIGVMAFILMMLIIFFLLPVLRRLEKRTVGLIVRFIQLPDRYVRKLGREAEAQLAEHVGLSEALADIDFDNIDEQVSSPQARSRAKTFTDAEFRVPFQGGGTAARSGVLESRTSKAALVTKGSMYIPRTRPGSGAVNFDDIVDSQPIVSAGPSKSFFDMYDDERPDRSRQKTHKSVEADAAAVKSPAGHPDPPPGDHKAGAPAPKGQKSKVAPKPKRRSSTQKTKPSSVMPHSQSPGSTRKLQGGERKRPYKNSWRFVPVALVKFSLPLVAVALWVAALFFLFQSFVSDTISQKAYVRHCLDLTRSYQEVLEATVATTVGGGESEAAGMLQDAAAEFLEVADHIERLFQQGGESSTIEGNVGELSTSAIQFQLLYGNPCPLVPSLPSKDPITGLCGREISLGVSSAARLVAQRAVELVAAVDAVSPITPGVCRSPPSALQVLRLQDWLLLADDVSVGLEYLTLSFLEDVKSTESTFAAWYRSLITLFVIAFVFILIGFAFTTISDVTNVLRLTISFVLLLPEEVILHNQKLLQHVSLMVKSHGVKRW